MDFHDVFYQVAAIVALAAIVGLIGHVLRQPLVVSFIAVGILVGPEALGIIRDFEPIELLAEIGIAVLLFLVGLKLDLHLVRTLGGVALATGLGQVLFTSVVGFGICLALGFDPLTSVYIAVALTFSSTIIIVKLLSDKREIDSLHGRIALGFLIVQDIVVVVAMVALSAFGIGAATGGSADAVLWTFAGGLLMVGLTGLFIRYAAEPLMARLAQAPELLVTFGIGWAVLFAAVADGIGLGKELGGLLAGVALASTSYREAMVSRLANLRDFLLLFFFVALGARLDLADLDAQLAGSAVLSLFVLIGNPLIVLIIMGYMGYRKRTGFMAGLTVAQISEFSLIFMAMGLSLGHVDEAAVGLVTLVGLITITLSTYLILYSQAVYARVERLLSPFERKMPYRETGEDGVEPGESFDVILFGLGRYGSAIGGELVARGVRVLGVDFDPEAVRSWVEEGRTAVYGDVGDLEFLHSLPIRRADWIVLAVPPNPAGVTHADVRVALSRAIRSAGFNGRLALTTHDPEEAPMLREIGASVVLMPFADAATQAVDWIVGSETARDQRNAK